MGAKVFSRQSNLVPRRICVVSEMPNLKGSINMSLCALFVSHYGELMAIATTLSQIQVSFDS